MQAQPGKFKNLIHGFREIARSEGAGALIKGWAPTCIGYHVQGMVKFGFNEIFKDL